MDAFSEVEVAVGSVQIAGAKRTKRDIMAEQVKGILYAKNLFQLLEDINKAMSNMKKLNVFESIQVVLDADRSSCRKQGGQGQEGGVGATTGEEKLVIFFKVKEKKMARVELGVETGVQSGGTKGSITLSNVFGRAEQLQLMTGTTYPHWGYSLQLQFSKPYYKDLSKSFTLSLGTEENKLYFSGYQEFITAGMTEVTFPSRLGLHSLSLNCQCRQNGGFTSHVPMAIREEAGYSLKSSIRHVLDWDNRDTPVFPSNGSRVTVVNEVAGLGGDEHFSKMEVHSEFFKEIVRDCVVSASLRGGCLNPFSSSRINDRFLLGGPTSLRGFSLWGAGPQDLGFAVGGEAYWASALHLFTPLPLLSKSGVFGLFRMHGFITAGNSIRNFAFSRAFLKSLGSDVRVSCGAGLRIALGPVAIELNYAVPIRAHSEDQLKPGLQFGIGVDML